MAAKKLGFGLMRLPSLDPNDPSKIDIEQTKKMVDSFIEQGFTYFDTAWMYCGFASEKAAKEVLVDRYPRDSFTLATKLHSGFISTKEDRDKIFNAQLEKTGAGYFDYYLYRFADTDYIDIATADDDNPLDYSATISFISEDQNDLTLKITRNSTTTTLCDTNNNTIRKNWFPMQIHSDTKYVITNSYYGWWPEE